VAAQVQRAGDGFLVHNEPHRRPDVCVNSPYCRHHHHAKQAADWTLQQHQPGYHAWTTPAGRRYTTGPITYPI